MKTDPHYLQWQVEADTRGISLGEHLAGELLISPEEAIDLIDFGAVQVAGRPERNPSRILSGSEEIRVYSPWQGPRRFYEVDPKRIIYQDPFLLAYDKEAGIPSQQTPYDAYNNLFAALYRYLAGKTAASPYVALHHRLDRETSGIMVFALDSSVNRRLGSAFQQHTALKDYLAWVVGNPSREEWVASDDITRKDGRYRTCPKGQGKGAETHFRVLLREEERSFVLARPRTGRTHQIRLHLAASGHPVLGDRQYGKKPAERLYLHAHRLRLPHLITGSELVLTAPIPPDWPPPYSVTLPD